MGEEILEKVAQLQHDKMKYLNELNHLKEHFLYVEENLNIKCSELSGEKKRIESLQQQNEHTLELLKEKDQLIESLEQEKANFKHLQTKISSENLTLKGELLQERLKNKQLEILKTSEENLKTSIAKLKEENQRLISEISLRTEECLSKTVTIKELEAQIEELENEKLELLALRDTLLREKQEQLKTSENLENMLKKSPIWQKSTSVPVGQELVSTSFRQETINSSLREEFLEAELQEKQNVIDQLRNLVQKKQEEELERSKLTAKLKEALNNAGLLNYNFKEDLSLDPSIFYYIYNNLLKVVNWPEGQSTECKPLADVPALSVVVKDGVQTTQPTSVRIIETISIASQTDPIKNLSPVLPLKTFEKLQSSFSLSQSKSDSDDEGEEPTPLSFIEKDKTPKGMQLFSEPKNCDLDMDMYRSCRKLSVLPEEDVDESSNRKSSLKKSHNVNSYTFNLKTQSADDITKIQNVKPLHKAMSCSNVIRKQTNGFEAHSKKRSGNCINENLKLNDKKDNDLLLSIMSPKDAFRQPHSFDSYLDPLKTRNLPLPRQTSDPTQNTVFAPPITRRGSYIRKPRSTCRPLTLPCDKGDKKKEERICKVRFDLNGVLSRDENAKEKEANSPLLNNAKKIKMVSRFRVEIIDEVEFRKSLEENERNAVARKRPPLIHSVVYKKSVLRDLSNLADKNELTECNFSAESPESPVYDTATEGSPAESFDIDVSENSYINDFYPMKRRKQSDASCYSFEDSQSSSEGNDILIKSIKLHTNSKCIIMKELQKENSDTSFSSTESEIPFIDAEDLPVIKPSPDIIKIIPIPEILLPEKPNITVSSPGSGSEGSDAYLTPCEVTPMSENNETSTFGAPKSSGLSKSPTVLKNLANFELLATISESRKIPQSEIIEEEEEQEEKEVDSKSALKRTPSDVSEASESDTLTYGTVKSHVAVSSDGDSDTYVSIWSDKSFTLERKFSDLSENSSSPYNTPPDTSSASFCTPPDTYSPILNTFKKYSDIIQGSLDNKREEFSDSLPTTFDISPSFQSPRSFVSDNNSFYNRKLIKPKTTDVIFDSPKLEFYETNDSVENLEAFLQTEEGLTELQSETPEEPEPFFENEDFREALSKRNSLESPKPLERRKKHPPLSRQNSTEEYNFLDPHDSCLNLSEEISSPSTTPDTSNKTVIFKNVPLTVSNTIDLDDDFLISETEIQLNFNDSQPEIVEMSQTGEPVIRYAKDGHCLSEPCTPSISSADFLEFSVPRKPRSSFTEESLTSGKFESNLPEIIVSRLSSESDDSEVPGCAETDFASNVSDRSEVHLSDVNSISGHSDNCGSFSEHSDNIISDVFSSDSDRSSGISPEITQDSSASPPSDKQLEVENLEKPLANVLGDGFRTPCEEDVQGTGLDVKEVPQSI